MELLEHIEIEPAVDATASVIWLHGLGADGHDFEPIVPELKLPEKSGIPFKIVNFFILVFKFSYIC